MGTPSGIGDGSPSAGAPTGISTIVSSNSIDVIATYNDGSHTFTGDLNFDIRSNSLQRFSLTIDNGVNRLTSNFGFSGSDFGQTFTHDFGSGITGSVLWEIGQNDTVRGVIVFHFDL